jgi:predicted transcriptional regulator
MDDEKTAREVGQELVARIVSGYVKHNAVSIGALPAVIASVYQGLSGLGKAASLAEPRTPAVPVRQSVRPNYVVCLECGFRSQMLRRHLRIQHGLERAEYYALWRLPPDHPITAPGYSARRSAMAKELGLGRRRRSATAPAADPEPASSAKPRRRSRPRAQAATSR